MLALELGLDARRQSRDQSLGKRGIGRSGLRRGDRSRDHPHADEEALLASDDPRPVERVLVVVRLIERPDHELLELRRCGHRAEEPWIEHGIEQARTAAEDGRKPRCRPHDVGDQAQQTRVGGEEGEELHAGRHLRHHLVEGGECQVGLGGASEGVEQRGEEFREALAGALAPRGGVAA